MSGSLSFDVVYRYMRPTILLLTPALFPSYAQGQAKIERPVYAAEDMTVLARDNNWGTLNIRAHVRGHYRIKGLLVAVE